MATTLFVTEEKIKSFTLLDDNVDPHEIYPFVLMAQDFWIQESLGTKLYDTVKNMVVDYVINSTPIPADYKKLLDDYIQPTVLHYAVYQALPSLKYKATNKGILSGTSEVASQTTLEELQYLRNNIFDSAQFYNERLRDYLRAYSELYPEYNSYTNKDGMKPERGTSYYTGLVIPNKRTDYCNGEDTIGDCNPSIY